MFCSGGLDSGAQGGVSLRLQFSGEGGAELHTNVDFCASPAQNIAEEASALADIVRIQVLMPREDADRFDAYCRELGFKKSTLIARLIRDHLAGERFTQQQDLFKSPVEVQGRR
jgi:hypothetical protein